MSRSRCPAIDIVRRYWACGYPGNHRVPGDIARDHGASTHYCSWPYRHSFEYHRIRTNEHICTHSHRRRTDRSHVVVSPVDG